MARLTDIKNIVTGGADNVSHVEVIQGEQQVWSGQFTDDNGPVDITSFTLEAEVKHYTADLKRSGQSYLVEPDSVQLVDPQPMSDEIVIEATDAATGHFKFVIPDDLYKTEFAPDITEGVPIAVIYFRYTIGIDTDDDPQPKIMHRLIIVLRAGISE